MRPLLLVAVLLSCTREAAPRPDPIVRDPLIVHEWGTFATFQGSTGGMLDGMQHETEALPPFVHSLTTHHASPFAPFGDPSFDVPVAHVGGKMETPVIYFYSQTDRRVRVHVDFTRGLLTQWWPRATSAPAATADVGALEKTSLDWDLQLTNTEPAGVPYVSGDDPWMFARQARAAWVRAGNEAERYVFYRGLGRIELPLRVDAMNDEMALVRNCSDEKVAAAIVLDMRESEGRFVPLEELGPHAGAPSMLTGPLRPRDEVIRDLEAVVHRTLVAHGLFADEATAMVRTWSRTWFGAEGTRVIYVVPEKRTSEILPLTIDPRPDTLVRVLVGRHEFLMPAREQRIVELLKQRLSPATEESATRSLARLGRFLEPAVRRAILLGDPLVKKSGEEILTAFGAAPL